MKKTFLAVFLTACFATAVSANESTPAEKCGKLADSFVFVVDASGSMMETLGDVKKEDAGSEDQFSDLRRIELVKAFVGKVALTALSKTEMQSALYSVAPFAELVPFAARSSDEYRTAVQERLNTNLEVFGRPTWIGKRGATKLSQKVDGTQALILITDGDFEANEEELFAPGKVVLTYLRNNPSSTVHVVSAAYSPEEKAAITKLAEVDPRVTTTDLETLMSNEASFDQFVERVFYKECPPVVSIEIPDVYFAFDKADLTEEGKTKLHQAIQVIESRDSSEPITVFGWTDSTGSDTYNAGLSLRRAEAVKAFFVEAGIAKERIRAIGKGESCAYTNRTSEGRRMNRRVEVIVGADSGVQAK